MHPQCSNCGTCSTVVLASVKRQTTSLFFGGITVCLEQARQPFLQREQVLRVMKLTEMRNVLKIGSFFPSNIDFMCHVIPPGKLYLALKTTDAFEGLS